MLIGKGFRQVTGMTVRSAIRPFTNTTSVQLFFVLLHKADRLNLTLELNIEVDIDCVLQNHLAGLNMHMWNSVGLGYIISPWPLRKCSNMRHLRAEECKVA